MTAKLTFVYATYDTLHVLDENYEVQTSHPLTDLDKEEIRKGLMSVHEVDLIKQHADPKTLLFCNAKIDDQVKLAGLDQIQAVITKLNPEVIAQSRDAYVSEVANQIKNSVEWDTLLVQAVRSVEDVDVIINMLAKRLREWFEWNNPEVSRAIDSHEDFANKLVQNDYVKDSIMGKEITDEDFQPIHHLAQQIVSLTEFKKKTTVYIEKMMNNNLPNFSYLAGALVGSKLLASCGSLNKLARVPSSTMQLLGAEKALFRHLKTGARPPKFGILFQHPLLNKVPMKARGSMARGIASALTIALKKDYFSPDKSDISLAKLLEKKLEARL